MRRCAAGCPLRVACLFLATTAVACDYHRSGPIEPRFDVVEPAASWDAGAFEVYTQNVYLGGDTGPLFSLDFDDLPAVLAATNVFWGEVQQSDVPDRMAAIVDEIELRGPHVVGLQEVFRFGVLDAAFQPIGGIDLLHALESEIATRGLPYEAAVVQDATSSALPLALDPSVGVTRWLAFTDRLVVLRRTDVALSATDRGTYAATVPLGPVEVKRAWARVSLDHDGQPHHFVTTHLEIQSLAPVQAAQASELLGVVVAGLDGVTVIGGDLNSDATAAPGDPSWTETYGRLRSAGFEDVWDLAPHATGHPGYTCCQSNSLANDRSELDQRIDFVLVRSSDGPLPGDGLHRGSFRAEVVGDEIGDRTQSGLWPSDHAGIVAGVRLPPSVGRE